MTFLVRENITEIETADFVNRFRKYMIKFDYFSLVYRLVAACGR